MPAAISYTPDDKDLRQAAIAERLVRAAALDKAQKYYDGDHRKPLKIGPQAPDLNVIINLFGMRVDRRADFLFREMPEIKLNDDATEESPDEEWIEQAWAANGGITLANELCLVGCLTGHPVIKLMPPDELNPFPRLRLMTNAIVFWSADDYKQVLWYELQWKLSEKLWMRQDILNCAALGMPGDWIINEFQSQNGTDWSQTRTIEWPYPLPPIVDWQHWPKYGQYYGKGETDDLSLNDAVNRMLSQANAIVRNHAFPKTVATGVSASAVQPTSVDSFWAIENENAKVFNLEMQSDLTTITNLAASLKDIYMTQGRTILLTGGPADFARVTNLGIRTAFMDMINANRTLQQSYGEGIKRITRTMLMLAGKAFDYPDMEVRFADPLPENAMETAQVVQLEQGMGLLSKQSAAEALQIDWEEENERMNAESEMTGGLMDRLIATGGSDPFAMPGRPPSRSAGSSSDAESKP